jgi:hypothetical protein
MHQRPVVLGLLLCENVIIEERTRNVTLVNCFTDRTAERFPTDPIVFTAFAFLSDGVGNVPMELVIERLDTLEVIHRVWFAVEFGSPLQTVRCSIRVRRLECPVAGHYQVSLLADGEAVAMRKLIVTNKETNS